jgi:hypothetical protein
MEKLAIKLANNLIRSEMLIGATFPAALALREPEFRSIRGRPALGRLGGDPWEVGKLAIAVNLALFGRPLCQSTMCLCEDVLKGECRSEPNVDPARADRDHGANL